MRVYKTIFAALIAASPAVAQEPAEGGVLFRQHCATCHGLSAQGDGPMTGVLTLPVPALTTLAARNDGAFPLAEVVAIIDGRSVMRGHSGLMPVFGFELDGGSVVLDGPAGGVVETKGDILAIARWLESVQE